MSETRAAQPYRNRRLQRRYAVAPESGAILSFRHPAPAGPHYEARLRDISLSGLSMVLPHDFPDAEAGDIVKGIEVRVVRKTFHGDLLIMHVTPIHDDDPVRICGGLFYPEGDEDLITVRLVVKALEAVS